MSEAKASGGEQPAARNYFSTPSSFPTLMKAAMALSSWGRVSEGLFKVGMCLPSGPYVSEEDVHYIVKTIKSAID